MYCWTIYDHPSDYPDFFVVRRWRILPGHLISEKNCLLADSLIEAREHIPTGFVRVDRQPEDDSVILETWI